MARLAAETVQAGLKRLPGWALRGQKIAKQYTWPSFSEAMQFANRVAELAEQADHHPDILIAYRHVTLTLTTHSAGGITEKDFDLAEAIERELPGNPVA
ncbi:MAG: 4a-hydroxytetrahydrobiopterin dehydratase [Acidimicrobiia bacterium]|nr:4a-hydroxytetrahydrobiopterin dehydratase [Acidimicrobiia bacterium]